MNQRLPYEKLIAEKIQQVHLSDKDESWDKMEDTLNREMPQMPTTKKRFFQKRSYIGWTAIFIVSILTGLYFWQTQRHNIPVANTTSADKQKSTLTSNPTIISTEKENKTTSLSDKNKLSVSQQKDNFSFDSKSNDEQKTTNQPVSTTGLPKNGFQKNKDNINSNAIADNILNKKNDNDIYTSETTNSIHKTLQKKKDIAQSSVQKNKTQKNIISSKQLNNINNTALINNNKNDNDSNNIALNNITALPEKIEKNKLAEPKFATILYTPDDMRQWLNVASNKESTKRQEKKLGKSYKSRWNFWGKKTDKWFAAGISLYHNFAIASQQNYNYNANAAKNTITDYIPSPYFKFQITDRIYVLNEFQFNAPQATPNLLLAHGYGNIPGRGISYIENIYLKKLYYFNIPLSIYYSPVKNFYIGGGIQYSSFNNGLAYSEQVSGNGAILKSQIFKIKDDDGASKIKPSEWRYLFDANYYVNRFMIGLRYNRATSNYINYKVGNMWLPPTKGRNQALQLYLRYNIVVSKKH
jgi:hypothetical protein